MNILRPNSRGSITLQSNDPDILPLYDAGTLAHQDDVDGLLEGGHISVYFGTFHCIL